MADDRPEDGGPSANLDRPKRAAPTLDLSAVEISDTTPDMDGVAHNPQPDRQSPSDLIASAIISTIFGGSAAALVLAAAWWTGMLEQKIPPPAPPVNTAAVDALTARLAKVEAAAGKPPVAVPDSAVIARLDATEKTMQSMRADIDAARTQSEQFMAVANEIKSAPRDAATPPVAAAPAADLAPLNDRLAQLESTIRAVSAQVAQPKAPPPASDVPLRRAVAAASLDALVRQGEPYAATLATAKALAPNADVLKPLEPFAASGLPGANAMGRELVALTTKLSPPPSTEPSATGSILDRLEAGAARLIRIERTDAPTGSERNVVVARARAAAQRNDVAEARRELNTLAPPDRAAAQAWLDKADARDLALAASRQFAAEMTAALSKPAP